MTLWDAKCIKDLKKQRETNKSYSQRKEGYVLRQNTCFFNKRIE